MLKKLFRTVFTIVGGMVGYGFFLLAQFVLKESGVYDITKMSTGVHLMTSIIFVFIFGLIFFTITPTVNRKSKKVASNIETDLQHISSNELVAGAAGLVTGLILAYLISRIYDLIDMPYLPVILTVITYFVLGYLGVVTGSKKAKDFFGNLTSGGRLSSVGGKGKGKSSNATPKILDTSVIIDGRISDILKTGFLEGAIIIPEFVLLELQHIADSSDGLKRNRGRRGLDILKKIQTDYGIEIYDSTGEKGLDEIPEVDIKLLKLAQLMNGKVVTNDFNLNKVAGIKDVDVLNINELANTLKPVVLPGEVMSLFLVKEGKENNQAVAYLDDGTMIVVEEGRRFIGKTIKVSVTSVLQTAAGRMIFGKPARRQQNNRE
ncbi:MAG: hypothetical protein VB031_07470 [Eubacteriaceae bacterium]|nr:hypothetical protein [Eubacteriaceae bacterium]